MRNKLVLSIKSWVIIFCLVTVTVCVLAYLVPKTTHNNYFNLERFRDNNDPHIVIMGTSLVRCGFPFDNQFEEIVVKKGINYKVSRITHSLSDATVFKNVLSTIVSSKPNILFIQDAYFMHTRIDNRNYPIQILNDYRKMIIRIRFDISKSLYTKSENFGFDQKCNKNLFEYSLSKNQPKLLKKEYGEWNQRIKEYDEAPFLYDFITKAKENGTEVILLGMGTSKIVNDYLNKSDIKKLSLLKSLSNKMEIEHWQFPANLPLEYYIDFVHLNNKGRTKATQWFINKLQKHLNSQ